MDFKKKHIVTIGLKGFPLGTASAQKLRMMGRALVDIGHDFFVISNEYVTKSSLNEKLIRSGEVNGVRYHCTCPELFTPPSYSGKILAQLRGKFREFVLLMRLYRKKELDSVIIYSYKLFYVIFWSMLFKILRRPCFLIYFELPSSVAIDMSKRTKVAYKLYDRYIFYFFKGFITISEFLVSHIKKYVPKKPCLIVPPIVDFEEFNLTRNPSEKPYFLYCGTLNYFEVIILIINSFSKLEVDNIQLYLVLGGDQKAKAKVEKLIHELNLDDRVQILSNISDTALRNLYVNAKALLIPLRNTKQDIARFPHKVAEYCASGRPIITTRVGELARLFNNDSIIFSEGYDADNFSQKLQFVIDNDEESDRIAARGYQIGRSNFDYKAFSEPLKKLLFKE